jgi:WD40 repeat protein
MFDWQRSHRIQDLAVSPNGQYLVAMENETHIHVYNFMTRDLVYELDMKSKMGSVSISQNSRHLLVNKLDGEAQLLDLNTREIMVCYPNGEKGNEYAIRASFGGANESFVVIGSLGMQSVLYGNFVLTTWQMATSTSTTKRLGVRLRSSGVTGKDAAMLSHGVLTHLCSPLPVMMAKFKCMPLLLLSPSYELSLKLTNDLDGRVLIPGILTGVSEDYGAKAQNDNPHLLVMDDDNFLNMHTSDRRTGYLSRPSSSIGATGSGRQWSIS